MGGVGGSWGTPPGPEPLLEPGPEAKEAEAAEAEAEVDELVYEEGGEADEASLVEGGGVGQVCADPYPFVGSPIIQ